MAKPGSTAEAVADKDPSTAPIAPFSHPVYSAQTSFSTPSTPPTRPASSTKGMPPAIFGSPITPAHLPSHHLDMLIGHFIERRRPTTSFRSDNPKQSNALHTGTTRRAHRDPSSASSPGTTRRAGAHATQPVRDGNSSSELDSDATVRPFRRRKRHANHPTAPAQHQRSVSATASASRTVSESAHAPPHKDFARSWISRVDDEEGIIFMTRRKRRLDQEIREATRSLEGIYVWISGTVGP